MINNIKWEVMEGIYWNNTEDFPERKQARMAEFLVYEKIDISDILGFAVYDNNICKSLKNKYYDKINYITTKKDWYF